MSIDSDLERQFASDVRSVLFVCESERAKMERDGVIPDQSSLQRNGELVQKIANQMRGALSIDVDSDDVFVIAAAVLAEFMVSDALVAQRRGRMGERENAVSIASRRRDTGVPFSLVRDIGFDRSLPSSGSSEGETGES